VVLDAELLEAFVELNQAAFRLRRFAAAAPVPRQHITQRQQREEHAARLQQVQEQVRQSSRRLDALLHPALPVGVLMQNATRLNAAYFGEKADFAAAAPEEAQ